MDESISLAHPVCLGSLQPPTWTVTPGWWCLQLLWCWEYTSLNGCYYEAVDSIYFILVFLQPGQVDQCQKCQHHSFVLLSWIQLSDSSYNLNVLVSESESCFTLKPYHSLASTANPPFIFDPCFTLITDHQPLIHISVVKVVFFPWVLYKMLPVFKDFNVIFYIEALKCKNVVFLSQFSKKLFTFRGRADIELYLIEQFENLLLRLKKFPSNQKEIHTLKPFAIV